MVENPHDAVAKITNVSFIHSSIFGSAMSSVLLRLPSAAGCGAPLCCGVRGSPLLRGAGLPSVAGCRPQWLPVGWSAGSGLVGCSSHSAWVKAVQGLQSGGSAVAARRFSCSMARGISLGQGLNLCPLHGLADSYPRDRQGRP